MIGDKKIVEFEKYCDKCVNDKSSASSEPCNTCLGIPAREDSRKPVKFQEKEKGNANV